MYLNFEWVYIYIYICVCVCVCRYCTFVFNFLPCLFILILVCFNFQLSMYSLLFTIIKLLFSS